MARPSLVDQVADVLLDRIVAGDLPPGSVVPGEIDQGRAGHGAPVR